MNLQQLEYIIAVDTYRHFATAAEKRCVTQPTLSMMIQKLEEELDAKLFDRSKQPVVPTEIGRKIIAQAKIVLSEAQRMKILVQELKGEAKGDLNVGIIPTLAPYLLPLFLGDFARNYPQITLKISELTTDAMVEKLERHELDVGLLATLPGFTSIQVQPLFYEKFFVYASTKEQSIDTKLLKIEDIDVNRLWLLAEGHCLRSQIVNLCDLKNKEKEWHSINYEAGSIETLKKLVEINEGITILPELALKDLSELQLKSIRQFKPPVPGREISLATYRHYVKEHLVEILRREILLKIPDEMKDVNRLQITK